MHSGSILARARKWSCCHEGAVSPRVRHASESVRLKLDMEAWSSRCRRARWQSYRDALVALLEMIGKTCRYYEKANISIRPRRHQARAECIGSGKPRLGAGRAQTGLWRSGGGRCSRDEGLPRLGARDPTSQSLAACWTHISMAAQARRLLWSPAVSPAAYREDLRRCNP